MRIPANFIVNIRDANCYNNESLEVARFEIFEKWIPKWESYQMYNNGIAIMANWPLLEGIHGTDFFNFICFDFPIVFHFCSQNLSIRLFMKKWIIHFWCYDFINLFIFCFYVFIVIHLFIVNNFNRFIWLRMCAKKKFINMRWIIFTTS